MKAVSGGCSLAFSDFGDFGLSLAAIMVADPC